MRAGVFVVLLFVTTAALAQRVTEGESHIASAFTSGADPGVLAGNLRVGPTLRGSLGDDADSRKVYDALFERVSGKTVQVRVLSAAEAARHATLVGAISDPLIVLEAGDVALLMQYAPREKRVTFVEQLSGAKPRARAEPAKPKVATPQLAPAPPKRAAVIEVPLPAIPAPAPLPVVVEKPKPVIKPVIFEKPVPVAAPTRPAPKAQADCIIKPVMTDDELRACGAR